jgi:hypothetical protein
MMMKHASGNLPRQVCFGNGTWQCWQSTYFSSGSSMFSRLRAFVLCSLLVRSTTNEVIFKFKCSTINFKFLNSEF